MFQELNGVLKNFNLIASFMNVKNIRYFTSKLARSAQIANELQQKYNILPLSDKDNYSDSIDTIIVIGDDGVFLHALKNFLHLNVGFYGINVGNLGFLMNSYNNKHDLIEQISSAKVVAINPLRAKVAYNDATEEKICFAFNECTILRYTSQAIKLDIKTDNVFRLNLFGDGVLVATAVGSAAYNYAAGGMVLPLVANLLSITAISPFRPKGWHGALIHNRSSIDITIHDYTTRPGYFTADLQEIYNVTTVNITEAQDQKVKLLFNAESDLEDKLLKEQFST